MDKSIEFNTPAIERIKRKDSLVEMVYQAVVESIAVRSILPGQRLRQEEVAAALNVSPRTVREAFKQLEADGLVISEPYKGVRITQMSLQDQIELFEMRLILEGKVIEHAAKHISQAELTRMRAILPETATGNEFHSIVQVRLNNREFHLIPVHASGLKQYIPILERIWDLVITFFGEWQQNSELLQESGREEDLRAHTEILEALEAGDPKLARQKLEKHVQNYLNILYHLREQSQLEKS
jgi:DNA-binding GntR family transcriptional regulator